jgi:alkanesulfonate monooxygenase
LVTGGDPEGLAGDGLFASHADRYRLSTEFITIWRALLAGSHRSESFDFEGNQLCVQGSRVLFPPLQRPHPPVFLGGSSPAAVWCASTCSRRSAERSGVDTLDVASLL